MKPIKIFDTTLRDGEQSPGASLTRAEKLEIAEHLGRLNVDVIEAGFPIASEDDFEAVREIAQKIKGPVICGLARLIKKDIDRAWEAVQYSDNPRIHVFVATSKIHLDKKLKMSSEEVLRRVEEMVSYAKGLCDDVEFSPEDAARTDLDFMIEVVETAIKEGATTINIPDTVGYSQPEEFGKRVKYVFEKLGDLIDEKNVIISVHCHNDLGLAVANSLEAVRNGATQIECTINGLGERAGNCSLEEVVMNLETRKDFFNAGTRINLSEIFRTSRLVSKLTGIAVQRNKAIVGANAFAHEAGIHQHGVLSDRTTYEILSSEDVGWQGENIVIGKHSGRHAIRKVLEKNGFDFGEEDLEKITKRIKEMADRKETINDDVVLGVAKRVKGRGDYFGALKGIGKFTHKDRAEDRF